MYILRALRDSSREITAISCQVDMQCMHVIESAAFRVTLESCLRGPDLKSASE